MTARRQASALTSLENRPLVLELVRWIAERPRLYAEVMNAWRSTCPRLTIWEDALDAGLVNVGFDNAGSGKTVFVTEAGREFLREDGAPE